MAPSMRKSTSKKAAVEAPRRQRKVGDLALAKVKGFSAWPATVSESEAWGYKSDKKKVLVYFFGTKEIDHEVGNVSAHTRHLVASALSDPYPFICSCFKMV